MAETPGSPDETVGGGTPEPATRRSGKRSFWPTVLLGVVGAGGAAYAGAHHWLTLGSSQAFTPVEQSGLDSPATTALALVSLAAWGVVLVTRRWVRRAVAVLAGAAALAALAAAWGTRQRLPDGHPGSSGNAWPWLAMVACLLSVAAAVVAARLAPQWPEMGAKYDAPTGAAPVEAPLEEQSSLDLWKSLDEGHDPTGDQH